MTAGTVAARWLVPCSLGDLRGGDGETTGMLLVPVRGGDGGGEPVCWGTLSSGAVSSCACAGTLLAGVLPTLSSGAVVGALFLVCRGREEDSCTGTSGAMRTVGVGSSGGASVSGSLVCGWT